MDPYMIVLRILHIVAGVFWVGGAALFFLFVQPTAAKLGPAAGPFMEEMTVRRKLPITITLASLVTILAGLLLYWEVSGGFDADWITSETGMTFTLGGLAAIIAFLIGLFAIKPRVDRMMAIGAEVKKSGGPPSEAQMGAVQGIQRTLRSLGRVNLVLLVFAVVAMAVARYL